MTTYVQAELTTPPVVEQVTWVPKERVIECADRLWKQGQRAMAEAMVARAGAMKDGETVAMQPALARRLGL